MATQGDTRINHGPWMFLREDFIAPKRKVLGFDGNAGCVANVAICARKMRPGFFDSISAAFAANVQFLQRVAQRAEFAVGQ